MNTKSPPDEAEYWHPSGRLLVALVAARVVPLIALREPPSAPHPWPPRASAGPSHRGFLATRPRYRRQPCTSSRSKTMKSSRDGSFVITRSCSKPSSAVGTPTPRCGPGIAHSRSSGSGARWSSTRSSWTPVPRRSKTTSSKTERGTRGLADPSVHRYEARDQRFRALQSELSLRFKRLY